MIERFKIRNRAHEPSRSRQLADFTSHPEIGGRVLAPRATRFIPRAELTARILDDVDKYRACDVVSFQREFGPPREVDTNELRVALGIQVPAPIPAYADLPDPHRVRGITTIAAYVDEVAYFEPATEESEELWQQDTESLRRAAARAQAEDMMRTLAAAQTALVEEHLLPVKLLLDDEEEPAVSSTAPEGETPSLTDTLLADITEPEGDAVDAGQLYTEESLAALKGTELDEILVGTFGEDPKQLYKIGAKAKKVAHILKLQADARG